MAISCDFVVEREKCIVGENRVTALFELELYRRCVAEVFDHSVDEAKRLAEFFLGHFSGRGRVQGLKEFDEAFFDMFEHGDECVAGDGAMGIASAKLDQGCDNSQAAQTPKIIGVIQNLTFD